MSDSATYCVYMHIRNDNDQIFYVGIGKDRYRSGEKRGRSRWWLAITNKYGYSVKLISEDITREEAIYTEKYLIAFYGRADLKTGNLVNMTDGGEGMSGHKPSEETRHKLSVAKKASATTIGNQNAAGNKNGRQGGNRKPTVPVIDTKTEYVFTSIASAARYIGIRPQTLQKKLNGIKPNNTNFILYSDSIIENAHN